MAAIIKIIGSVCASMRAYVVIIHNLLKFKLFVDLLLCFLHDISLEIFPLYNILSNRSGAQAFHMPIILYECHCFPL